MRDILTQSNNSQKIIFQQKSSKTSVKVSTAIQLQKDLQMLEYCFLAMTETKETSWNIFLAVE